MRKRWRWWWVLAGLASAGHGFAAAVSCDMAHTLTEHALCADPDLSAREHTLAEAYGEALARSPYPDELKESEHAWLTQRDACGTDAKCLRPVLTARLRELRRMGSSFDWRGQWERNTLAPDTESSTLSIDQVTDRGFQFAIAAVNGAYLGTLDGAARFADASHAVFQGSDESSTQHCLLSFRRSGAVIQIQQKNHSGDCASDVGVDVSGDYVATVRSDADTSTSDTIDLWTRGVVETRAQDQSLQKLLGPENYAQLAATANVIDVHAVNLDDAGTRVVTMWVKGAACDTKALVMWGPNDRLWTGLWVPGDHDKVDLLYATNVAGDKHRLPKTIAAVESPCAGETLQVTMMP